MKIELHPATQRGHAHHSWLDTYHSFSFATYFNPAREQFGCLRVLNDDTMAGGTGFDTHPHNNMEIVTIMLEGVLEHKDSMGNIQVIRPGEVQVMTAGKGIYHAEYNHSETEQVKLFQIWIFPRTKGLEPRYDQKLFARANKQQKLLTLVVPDTAKQEDALWINQDAYVSTLDLNHDERFDYSVRINGNGVFVMVVAGQAVVAGNELGEKDAIGLSETDVVQIEAKSDCNILIIEVPMK